MSKIARASLSKEAVLKEVFSIERMRATQNHENGIINMFVKIVKAEDTRNFSTSNVKIGSKDDNYYLLYYNNGIRYKIFKDGTSMVSSADTDARFDEQEKELKAIVDTAMANEIVRLLAQTLAENKTMAIGKPKYMNVDDSGRYSSIIMGVMKK